MRDAKLQLGCLRLSSKKLIPYAIAQKASKLQARIKEIQESLQCPCPSKYRLTYSVDGAEVPGEIIRDNERLTILLKRHAEKKTFTAEEDLEEAIRMARYDSFLVGPEMAAGKRLTKLRERSAPPTMADHRSPAPKKSPCDSWDCSIRHLDVVLTREFSRSIRFGTLRRR